MNNKQKIAILFMKLQSKIGEVFIENEHEINDEVNDLLTHITSQLDEAMRLVADIEAVGEEPRHYARVNSFTLVYYDDIYWAKRHNTGNKALVDDVNDTRFQTYMTKAQWSALGVNSADADFIKAEDMAMKEKDKEK